MRALVPLVVTVCHDRYEMGPRKRGFHRSKRETQRDSSTAKHNKSLKNKVRDVERLLKKVRHFSNNKQARFTAKVARVRNLYKLYGFSKFWISIICINFSFSFFFKFFNRLYACHSVSSFSYILFWETEDLQFSVVNCQSRYKYITIIPWARVGYEVIK